MMYVRFDDCKTTLSQIKKSLAFQRASIDDNADPIANITPFIKPRVKGTDKAVSESSK
jgi:hypothetical protein